MKIVAIADTHGKHRKIHDLPDGDVLVHAGDFTSFGDGMDDFLVWFTEQPFEDKVFILGNHESMGLPYFRRKDLRSMDGVHFIQDDPVTINGVRFGGPNSSDTDDVDVLVTHRPPQGILDVTDDETFGSPGVRDTARAVRPDLHIFGHAHRAHGRTDQDGTIYVNCAVAGKNYDPIHDPTVIDR